MKRPAALVLLLLVSTACQFTLPPDSHIDDQARLLPFPAWAKGRDGLLTDYEHATGINIQVRYHLKSPPPEEDKVPGAYMRALSGKLGTLRHGILVVYFADEQDWRVWIGDELAQAFVGKPGTVQELTDSGAIHEVKEALITGAIARGNAAFEQVQKSTPGYTQPWSLRLTFQTDMLTGDLMKKFPTKRK